MQDACNDETWETISHADCAIISLVYRSVEYKTVMDESDSGRCIFKKNSKTKKTTRVRLSLAEEDDTRHDETQVVFRAKKPQPMRRSVAALQSKTQSNVENRNSTYSSEYLESLRESTPVTPKNYVGNNDEVVAETINPSEVQGTIQNNVEIPDAGIIKHRKEQRELRRRAGENYIPLSDSLSLATMENDDHGSRLQTEDDVDDLGGDGREGLEGYESDTLPLGLHNITLAAEQSKKDISSIISDVEAGSDDSDDSDDKEWERVQVHKSGGLADTATKKQVTSQIVTPEILPIPTVEQILAKLREEREEARAVLAQKQKLIAEIQAEQIEIAEQEHTINEGLRRATLKYEANVQPDPDLRLSID